MLPEPAEELELQGNHVLHGKLKHGKVDRLCLKMKFCLGNTRLIRNLWFCFLGLFRASNMLLSPMILQVSK